jgi:hypothetical protein
MSRNLLFFVGVYDKRVHFRQSRIRDMALRRNAHDANSYHSTDPFHDPFP